MTAIKRSIPRRNPNRYPEGTTYTFRDGRKAEVVTETVRQWVDPTFGNGGGHWENIQVKKWIAIE